MYETFYSWDNLLLAYRRAAKGKRGHANVAAFEHRLEEHLLHLQHELHTQSYRPGPYTNFYIHEPKRRLISAAPIRDRIVHHALCNLLDPIFERTFVADSYANRVGKGTHRALNRVQQLARRYPYVLQCDIRQFFPSIDHQVLQTILAKKIEDEQIRWLVSQILAGGVGVLEKEYAMVYFDGDDLFAVHRPRGLPIGNLTSQFWANCYMNGFDHFVKRELRCPGYTRYVDDFLLFGDNQVTMWQWKVMIEERLASLRLTMHSGAHVYPVTEGIPFLGFQIFPERRRLKRRKGIYYRQKFELLLGDYQTGTISRSKLDQSVHGWINHVSYANTIGLRKAIFQQNPIIKKKGD